MDARFLRIALRLARRGEGCTSPNPIVGALLVKRGKIIGRGWHRRAGLPHAEIEALRDAEKRGHNPRGATLYVTLEPCSTQGRTPPCTDAIIAAGISRVVFGTVDPNPRHAGKGLKILRRHGIETSSCRELEVQFQRLNEAFNHWIVRRTPFVTVKAAMSLDGKIATADGESKWITGPLARKEAMRLRRSADAILVGGNTVRMDDPQLTPRWRTADGKWQLAEQKPRRIVLDSMARTPPSAKVVNDEFASRTTIVVSRSAPQRRVAALARKVSVVVAPLRAQNSKLKTQNHGIDLGWLLRRLGSEGVTHLLVEGGGEVNGSFLMEGRAQRVTFFYAPRVLSGRDALRGVAGSGATRWEEVLQLGDIEWRKVGPDLMLTARLR